MRIGTEQKHDETKWFETDGNSKCNWVPVEDLKIFSCPRRISLSGKYDFNNLIPVTWKPELSPILVLNETMRIGD